MQQTTPRTVRNLAACGMLGLGVAWHPAMAGGVTQTNLTSSVAGAATFTDPNMAGPWGMGYSPARGNWVVAEEGSGNVTVYGTSGAPVASVWIVPPPAGQTAHGRPTGLAYNPTQTFIVSGCGGTGVADFLVDSEDGLISGRPGGACGTHTGTSLTTLIDKSASGAVYKGIAIYTAAGASYLLAANFHSGMVEVYNSSFAYVTSFRDSQIGSAFAPFNVAVLNGAIYVAYAKQAAGGATDAPGPGNGYVEQVSITGSVVARFPARGPLNSPWGMAIAPSSWGPYANALLVGNSGDGRITAYNVTTHTQIGQLTNTSGAIISIPGLKGPNGYLHAAGTNANLYFSNAANLFGILSYTP